ncbi:MAG: 50S ribosomal protein L13 [Planctomycetota bacterium]
MPTTTKTFSAKPSDFESGLIEQKWLHVDATDRIVGRLASDIATVLMGKHRPTYTPHIDTGDYVVVTNCEKVKFLGKKWEQKTYAWYTGYPGQRTVTAEKRRERRPELILEEAVRRMLPKSKLGKKMLSKLKVYAGPDHPHTAQQCETVELGVKK